MNGTRIATKPARASTSSHGDSAAGRLMSLVERSCWITTGAGLGVLVVPGLVRSTSRSTSLAACFTVSCARCSPL